MVKIVTCKNCKNGSLYNRKKNTYICRRLNMVFHETSSCSHATVKEDINGEKKEK